MNSRETSDLPLAQSLTTREQEILNCIGDGLTNRQMAERLTIAAGTVKWYVRQVYNKLGVSSRAETVARARALGLLPQEDQVGAVRNNLPLAATPFVGRERELDALAELIADPQVRIITITGPGGIGKTRLALEATGRELHPQSQFPNGIFFISLAPLNSAAEIVSALATELDFPFQGSENESEQLLNYLRQKQMLLVMDNFEHILSGRTMLAEINEMAAEITLLVTSRERLLLRGEQLFPLGGLDTAKSEDSPRDSAAAQLFLHIARRTAPDFQLHEGDAEQLIRICRLVEGMPLGLELAASWVGLLPLSEIAAEIEQGLTLLATKHHDVPQRHQSMQAALDVSWGRLGPDQQRAFQEMTVFRGGFARTAAAGIAGATLPLLVTLVNKSWLSYDRQKDRYHIHELLRQYGAGKLSVDPAREQDVRNRHSAYYCGYLQEREADWFGPRQKETASEVRGEIDNVQTTWRWAAEQRDGVLLAQGLNSLCSFYHWEGRLTDGRYACRLARDGLSKSIRGQKVDNAQLLALWSLVLAWESDFVREVTQKEELLVQSQQLLDRVTQTGRDTRVEQAFIFLQKTNATQNTDLDKTKRSANLGLTLLRELNDRWGEAEALLFLGGYYADRGALYLANDLLRSSLAIKQQLNDTQGIATTTHFLGTVASYQGNFEEAETLHQQSLSLYQQLGKLSSVRMCLGILSLTLSWAGKFLAAKDIVEQAIEIGQDLGQLPNPRLFNPLTKATIHLGHYEEGLVMATENLELARQIGWLSHIGFGLTFLGEAAFVEGDLDGAMHHLLEGSAVFAELQHVHLAFPQAILSYVIRAQGDEKMAREQLASAVQLGTIDHSIFAIIYSLPVAALLAADNDDPERAVELYGLAQQFRHISNSRWFEDVACRELDKVRASLSPDVAAAAEDRGRELDVWQTAETLLRELDGR